MIKRIRRILLSITVASMLCFVGCSELEADTGRRNGFTFYENDFFNSNAYHLIDNITGVVYVVYHVSNGVGIAPAYNADGTLLTKKQLEVGDTQ